MNKRYIEDIRDGKHTLIVAFEDEVVFTSTTFGVIPLLKFIKNNNKEDTYELYDKLTGKAAAMIIIEQGNIKNIYTRVITKEALDLLLQYDIQITYDEVVEKILNRKRDDLCPIEKISKASEDYDELFTKLIEFYESIHVEI